MLGGGALSRGAVVRCAGASTDLGPDRSTWIDLFVNYFDFMMLTSVEVEVEVEDVETFIIR